MIDGTAFEALPADERAIVEWQYRMAGDFKRALMEAIGRADEGNLARLHKGFPHEVDGYLKFSRERGWWKAVQKKIGAAA